MENWITQIITSYGIFAIFGLIFIENVFPPIPSEVILLFGGFFVGKGSLSFWGTYVAATLGSFIGACVLYGIGRLVDADRIYRWADTGWMAKLGFKRREIEMVVEKFQTRGKVLVLVGRCIPVVRSLISIPAGMVHMNIPLFSVLTIIGSGIWNALLIFLGIKFGENWHEVLKFIDYYKYVVVALLALGLIVYFILKKKRDKGGI